jgi:hypothetical protein
MGTSKIIMLSGIYLILGIYSVGFDVADETNFQLSANNANAVQAEQIARSGISLAMTNMGADSLMHTYNEITTEVMCGSVVYSASQIGLPSSQSQIVSTGNFNGKTVVVKAVVIYDRNRWRLIQMYIPPTA